MPNNALSDFLKEQLHEKISVKAGKEMWDVNKKKKMSRMKVYYLDKYIFPAMANLIFLFEAIAKHPELEELYEDDIKDLLGIRYNKSAKQVCGFIFLNLIRNILKVGDLRLEKEKGLKNDFRLILNHHAESIVRNKVSASLAGGYEKKEGKVMLIDFKTENVRRVVLDDFTRALAWTGMLASSAEYSLDNEDEPSRTFDFDTDKLLR